MGKKGKASNARIEDVVGGLFGSTDNRTVAERRECGKDLRTKVPLESHAAWAAPSNRPDPVDLLKDQGATRLQELLPLRYERMSASAFTFYRGAALIMATDLSHTLSTGIEVQACGDAHISNFGLFNSPERRTVFDINDFDETARGPWEWDVKRLAASVEICANNAGIAKDERREIVLACVKGYCDGMAKFAEMGNLDVWYAHFDVEEFAGYMSGQVSNKERKHARKVVDKAKDKNNARAIGRLTEVVDGHLRIISNPPTLVPMRDMIAISGIEGTIDAASTEILLRRVVNEYTQTLPPDKRRLVAQYRGVDCALKVVGVGSVGTRAFIVVMEGANHADPLVLQIKEAEESVLERFCGRSPFEQHGQRVVEGQRAMQTTSDMLLGWCRLPGIDGTKRDFYVRQLWDGKGSFNLDAVSPNELKMISVACGWTLAHAHARTGDRFEIAGYLGNGTKFSKAVAKFARAYAKQNDKDYARFLKALRSGELPSLSTQ